MNRLDHKKTSSVRRSSKVRTSIKTNSALPRLSVQISNQQVRAQVIELGTGKVLASASSAGQKIDGSLTAKAEWVGKEIAAAAKKAKLKKVVFDRGSKKYHGRVKALADMARNEGMEF